MCCTAAGALVTGVAFRATVRRKKLSTVIWHLVTFGVCLSPSAPRRTFISGASASGSRCVPFTATIRSLPGRRSGRAERYRANHPCCLHIDPAARPVLHGEVHMARAVGANYRERAPQRRPCHRGRRGRGRGGARGGGAGGSTHARGRRKERGTGRPGGNVRRGATSTSSVCE